MPLLERASACMCGATLEWWHRRPCFNALNSGLRTDVLRLGDYLHALPISA
ncbi:hypothetical protein SORBI_3007G083100 [Sorghum bicolor]|uniref:Uncharacterized protein n=1 Tax=Sorghum bicolor TaxID=4558 RepID=A0A1B6PGD7_SORBI|nr:hypothetical protein SORBI_3007G083100 [Sorghum bicolor]KXG24765.1 hypothetical protein SORBI_3007G083100 [Sorghum bicolor]KXG24766.1 hypothetical protein SORBI_3007G083100 [Sorghum bicolor]OQU80124.1 hypothetical protein SORBI_3007G083100 [Sorghum bicolor]OQU80125.1 hypothetical protein SORBI_3007G083100 [Sorghum bicolor]